MKIGIDYHGVITENPIFWCEFIEMLKQSNYVCNEIHVMTGSRKENWKSEIENLPDYPRRVLGNFLDHSGPERKQCFFFSISDYLVDNHPEEVDDSDIDNPRIVDVSLWNSAKSEYARNKHLDLVIDDKEEYGKYFTTPFLLYKGGK